MIWWKAKEYRQKNSQYFTNVIILTLPTILLTTFYWHQTVHSHCELLQDFIISSTNVNVNCWIDVAWQNVLNLRRQEIYFYRYESYSVSFWTTRFALHWNFNSSIFAELSFHGLTQQIRIPNPVKHLRWRLLCKYFAAFSHWLFSQKTSS